MGDGPAGDSLEEIRRAGTRAASLTDQLLAFSRRQVLRPRVIDLNEVVEGVRSMLHRIIGEDVHLLLDPEEHIWPVRADAAQLEQVIVNLAVNARDAMPRGGDLTIRTRNVRLDDDFVRAHLGSTPGDHVLLEVEDTGEGMSEETLALIFEPFFTTKEIGKGTGLGLAMSYGIVKQSGGYIEADSELGRGTTMRIYLPRVEAPVDRVAERAGDEAPSGSETILLVEDETMVRLLAERVLRQQGYNVLSAGDAMEAIQTAGQYEGHIDLLLTDVVMPTISGRELAETLLQHRPDTVVLYMSGYTDDTVVKHGVLARETHFLHKPFTPAGLLTKVREVLDLARSAPAGD
ncbi:MAG: response regulator [Gemmatimonadetes bacterium]|nr:MAG: response regulator [Gemmatimonadota bacterium]